MTNHDAINANGNGHLMMFENNKKLIGKHVILECAGAQAHLGIVKMKALINEAAIKAGATPITNKFHHFGEGMGVTGVLVLAESHITVHTWPENNYAAFDFFMCGVCDPELAAQFVMDHDKDGEYSMISIDRQRPMNIESKLIA